MKIDNNKITYYLVEENNLLQLIEDSLRLQALVNGGVDSWEWCSESNKDYLRCYAGAFLDEDEDFDWQYGFEDVAREIMKEEYKEVPFSSSTRSE